MEIKCSQCGATLQYSPGTEELVCEYCGNTVHIGQVNAGGDCRADYIVPFQIERESAIVMTHGYMMQGVTTPDDLVKEARIEDVKLFYYPAYNITGSYTTHWTASFGYDRQEQYREWNSISKKWEMKTKTVTDWSPASGTVSGNFGYVSPATALVASTGFDVPKEAGAAALEVAACTPLKNATGFDPHYQIGFTALPYTMSADDAWDCHGSSQLETTIGLKVHQNRQGDRQKDWHWSSKKDFDATKRVYVPVAQVKFEYKGESYYCYVNGDDMQIVRGTDLPVDPAKQNLENTAATAIKLAGVPLYLGAAAAILGFFLLDHPLNFTHVICAIVAALVYRFAVKSFINSELKKVHDNSDAIRRALLIQREVQDGRLSPDSEEAAQATTIPERVTHRISTMAVPTIIAAVFVVGLTLFASLQARFSSPAGAPTSTAAVQQSRSAETPRRQPATEPSAPAQAPAPTARQEVQDPFVESLQMFDLLILQSKISNDPNVVAGVLNQIQSLAKPPVGNPQEAARHMKKVEDLFAKQDFGNAAALLSELARISPADGVLRGNLAYAYYKIKMYPEAIAQSAVALICNPTHENGWKVLQAACRQQNQARCVANSGLIISLLKGQ